MRSLLNIDQRTGAHDEGEPITGGARLRAYNLCQRLLAHKENALLMFDEIEDVFPSRGGFLSLFDSKKKGGDSTSGKAWINRTLERNATPAVWVTNNADIDPAYLRRFDYSIRFPVPPQQVRMAIARHHLGQFNPPEGWLAQIAANEQMTPAQYERAAKVARVSSGDDSDRACLLVEQTLDRSATLLGQKRTPARNTLHTGYDLRFVNTNMAMPAILEGLKKRRQGTFCFYGAAGTGKSELARYIADELGMPCLVRRASDILSMWVGGSEKNIAEMFAEARQQEAVLVLDEADSFLADRRDAQRSWEVIRACQVACCTPQGRLNSATYPKINSAGEMFFDDVGEMFTQQFCCTLHHFVKLLSLHFCRLLSSFLAKSDGTECANCFRACESRLD